MDCRMTERSGGQTRALLIADAVIIGNTPVVLLDEVENAGIHRTRALELLKQYRKIFIFVTHDPRIALLSDFRIIMQNGCMMKVLHTDAHEERLGSRSARSMTGCHAFARRSAWESAWRPMNWRESHETHDLRRSEHDRQDIGDPSRYSEASGGRRACRLSEDRRTVRGGGRAARARLRHSDAQGVFG